MLYIEIASNEVKALSKALAQVWPHAFNPQKVTRGNGSIAIVPLSQQEAQLSQRDRAMLVIEDLAKSLKVTQGHSK